MTCGGLGASTINTIVEGLAIAEFRRSVSDKRLAALKQEQLFRERLLPDIAAGRVYPAVRVGEVHFYHAGGRAFIYAAHGHRRHEFRSHRGYVSAPFSPGDPYFSEREFAERGHTVSFADEYENIKQRCASRFAGYERQLVSAICGQFSRLMGEGASLAVQVMPLDVEAAFPRMEGQSGRKDIDLALLDLRSGRIRFCEAKPHDSSKLNPTASGEPEVAVQLRDYAEQIKKNQMRIPSEYSNHLRILQSLLPMSLPSHPELTLDKEWPIFLLVFGEPADARLRGKLDLLDHERYPCLVRSDPTSIDLTGLWDEVDRWPGAAGRAGL